MMQTYAEYKESGVDWLGEIPARWEVQKAKWIWHEIEERSANGTETLLSVSQYHGVVPRKGDSRSEELSGYKSVYKDHLVTNIMLAWMGGLGVSNYDGIVSPAYSVYRLKEEANPHFLGYLYRTDTYLSEFARRSTGVVPSRWRMYTEDFGQVLTILPPLPEQTAIAGFLDDKTAKIDELVGIKRRQIALLGERKQILIQNAVTKGLNPAAPMKDSGVDWIGNIPAHWDVKQIKHFATIRSGDGITNSALHDNGEYEVFGGNGLMGYSNRYNTSGEYFVIGRVGAYCGNVRLANTKKWISDNALVLRLISVIKSEFLLHVLDAADLNKMNESNAQPLITGTKVMNLQFPFPPDSEQEDVAHFIISSSKKIDSAISIKQNQITKLNEYKTTLINAAVTGKIKVA